MYGSGTERRADERPRPHARERPRAWATVALRTVAARERRADVLLRPTPVCF